ncbi:dormancy-associated protein homolog 4 isoform X1 [Vitis riparia]|uniref:dormancy-associated protein homolog 4 isoform X1 n=1 Tax=Vitis riparia TaxID=96939 RepID=UPI00155AD730|nr:dormancy-associated protein homolog 4 isoform X1 [Vitis riparia]
MGFLDKLWDETVAGPPPETGLGKLRKYKSLSASRSPPIINPDEVQVTRSITILKTNSSFRNFSPDSVSVPNSPAGSSAPESPFTPGTPTGDYKTDARRKAALEAFERAEPRSPTVYDWFSLIFIFFPLFQTHN